uniref:non-specific serine/threonine protein kinase n=1 Tax=Anopheles farauti TaxID=69004 RepID=A0A182Q4P8_9DIPT
QCVPFAGLATTSTPPYSNQTTINFSINDQLFPSTIKPVRRASLARILAGMEQDGGTFYWDVESSRVKHIVVRRKKGTRLMEELKLLLKLNNRNIIGYQSSLMDPVMKPVTIMKDSFQLSLGCFLQERFENNEGPIDYLDAWTVAYDVLNGLNYLHREAHLVHGDICAYNVVFVGDFRRVMIASFECSQRVNRHGVVIPTQPGSVAVYKGSERWAAPEVSKLARRNPTTRYTVLVDIFSFGMMLYEMLVGVPPWSLPGDYRRNMKTLPRLDRERASNNFRLILAIYDLSTLPASRRPTARQLLFLLRNPAACL